jgi:16S rRNA (cytosine967-C5)-methyltransferase
LPQLKLTGGILGAALSSIEDAETKRADVALRDVLRRASLEPEEKAFVSRAVFSYYRWLGWLDPSRSPSANLRRALELADDFAAKPGSFPDADLIQRSVPEWARAVINVNPALARELQREPRLWLRARGGNAVELASMMGGCEVHPKVPGALWYKGQDDLYRSFEFKRGEFEIQDLSSQIVWDACAGEGGKMLHLADLMQGKGLIWASDPAEWRLESLKRRAARAQVFNYRVKAWSNNEHLPTKTKFDGILVDAPCSAIGTWGRNPHARWTTTLKDVQELAAVQRQLLDKVSALVKPGGKLIYSVCTLARAETFEVTTFFQATHASFTAIPIENPAKPGIRSETVELLPQEMHANAMFVAAWKRES